jgi:site-specific recombinase XerC
LAGGLRVSELVGVRMHDVHYDDRYVDVLVHGKGRKQRELRLWKSVGSSLRAWLAVRGLLRLRRSFSTPRADP